MAWQSHFTLRPCSQSQCHLDTPDIALPERQPPSVLRPQGLHAQAGPFPEQNPITRVSSHRAERGACAGRITAPKVPTASSRSEPSSDVTRQGRLCIRANYIETAFLRLAHPFLHLQRPRCWVQAFPQCLPLTSLPHHSHFPDSAPARPSTAWPGQPRPPSTLRVSM